MVEIRGRVCARIKALPDDPSSTRKAFEGDLSTYGNVDLGGDICEAGCFDRDVAANGTHRPLLWQHRTDEPIGSFDVVTTEGTLRVKGEIDLNTPYGPAAYSLLSHGDIDGMSIGYNARDYTYDKDGIRHLLDLELMEGSIVTFPMNPQARAQAKSRRLRMSRYAECKFLSKMTDEERDEALAELDELDREQQKEPEQDPEPEKAPDAEKAKDEGCKEEPENAGEEQPEDESEVAKALRKTEEDFAELRRLMEA